MPTRKHSDNPKRRSRRKGPRRDIPTRDCKRKWTTKKLQRKLLTLLYDSNSSEEEQGVNILFLALGFLKWFEDSRSRVERCAPLVLLPCRLTRSGVGGRIQLELREDDVTTNLSLQSLLQAEHGIALPEIDGIDDLIPLDYFKAVAEAIDGKAGWEVLPNDMVLGLFSFSKFLMHKDLSAESWPEEVLVAKGSLLGRALSKEGFPAEGPLWPEGDKLDDHVGPVDMVHVMDADSSQMEAIEEVKAGRNLVIQGPPGTGKSQTIANLIGAAVQQGKTVLFVSEKLAALEVVRHRLERVGLGPICLELHSRKANKKDVLGDLDGTLSLPIQDDGVQCLEVHFIHLPPPSPPPPPPRAAGAPTSPRAFPATLAP